MFNANSKSKINDFRGGYNNNNFGDYFDTPLSYTSPARRLINNNSDLNEPLQGQGSIKFPSPSPNMRNNISKVGSSSMMPLKANQDNYQLTRERYNRSQIDDVRAMISDNGPYNTHKPRAISQLKTAQYSSPKSIDLKGMLSKKNSLAPIGNQTPGTKKQNLVNDFSWQSVSDAQLPQIGKPKHNNLIKSFKLPPAGPSYKKGSAGQDSAAVNEALKKIARAGEDFASINEYARALIARFDTDNDGLITFQELCSGLEAFDIDLSVKDRMGLMKKLDIDADGEITEVELANALHSVDTEMINEAVETALKKIASGATGSQNLRDYTRDLVRKFDRNGDGLLTFEELSDGLAKIHIYLNQREIQAMMQKIDLDRDGEISGEELLTAINSVGSGFSANQLRNSVDWVVKRLVGESNSFPSIKEYSRHLIRKFDRDNDGIITFQELCEGLAKLNIFISNQEKQALMERFDIDRDGKISESELTRVLTNGSSSNENIVDSTIRKIAAGANKYGSMNEYVRDLVRKFDRNSDGFLSMQELTEGLRKLGIFLNQQEVQALLRRLDLNRDGEVSADEILSALGGGSAQASPTIDNVIQKIADGAKSFPSMKEYVKHLIRKFDRDNDGIITFQELCDGLLKLNIVISTQDKKALMERLDIDRDGRITHSELNRVLSGDTKEIVESTIRKIAAGASGYNSLSDYVRDLVRKFDSNSDGFLSIQELTNGLSKMGVYLTQKEQQALMHRLDLNRDGEVSADEILGVISGGQTVSSSSIDKLVEKLASGGKSFSSVKDYARALIRKFDRDNDGIITFEELCDGLTKMNIKVSYSEQQGLMERLDIDRDGKITENEIARVLSGGAQVEVVELALQKIAAGAKGFSSMAEYVRDLVRKFDRNSDGLLSINELTDGLTKIGIFLTQNEVKGLLNKLDLNRDGEVSGDEILRVLEGYGTGKSHALTSSIDMIITKLAASGKSFSNMREYAKSLIRKWDRDNDGIITFNELCEGLAKMKINLNQQEKKGLMERLDIDRDGKITEAEVYRVLSGDTSSIIESTIQKIAQGASGYSGLSDYVRELIRRFDRNSDGYLSLQELTEGLQKMGVFLTQKEQQALMQKLDLNRDGEVSAQEILTVLQGAGASTTPIEAILAKLSQSAKAFPSVREYAKHLIRKFDVDNDGIITFQELCDGLGKLSFFVSPTDKRALMDKLDIDRDGRITETELYKAIAGSTEKIGGYGSTLVADSTLRKIAAGAKSFKSMADYVKDLVRKFDRNSDGLLSMQELTTGLSKLGIYLNNNDVQALMNKLDLNRDGEVSGDELLNALRAFDTRSHASASVEGIVRKLAEGAAKFPSMKDYARHLIRQFDRDNDGIITFTELCDGLLKLKIIVTQQDKQGLMDKLDIDRDGKITETEIYRVLLSADNRSDQASTQAADQTIKKIVAEAQKYSGSIREYVKDLVRKFDRDNDGLLTIHEMTDGLKKMGISLNNREVEVLMNKFDLNRDGEVSADEIVKVLLGGHSSGPSVDHIILKLAQEGSSFSTLKDYSKSLIRRWDRDNDGIITFNELCDGLLKMNLNVSHTEKQALMERLDLDRDGRITEKEIYRVLQNAEVPHKRLGGISNVIDSTLRKIASGADESNDMRAYAKKLIRKFDKNSDGLISLNELTQGLKTMNIYLTQEERNALMERLDLDRNGEISDQELFKALSSVNTSDLSNLAKEAADVALKKIAAGSENYSNMREYVNVLMRNFDYDNDGQVTFNELCDGIKKLNIYLTLKERQALMKQLDLDMNGTLSADELYAVLSRVDTKLSKTELQASIEHALRKIASGAEEFSSMKEYVNELFKNFDVNFDGLISFEELVDGLSTINIHLTNQEKRGLMKRFDFNRDGEISEDEIYRVLAPYDSRSIKVGSQVRTKINLGGSAKNLPLTQNFGPNVPVTHIIEKIKKAANKYAGLNQYVNAMMKRYDTDGDGYINRQELQRGLEHDGILLSLQELNSLMNHLDTDRDGAVSQEEILNALSAGRSEGGSVDSILKRIQLSADRFKNLEDFCRFVFNKFDADRSGSLSFIELSNGLEELGIRVSTSEKMDLLRRLDKDGDGEVAFMEFYNGLSGFSGSVNMDNILQKISRGADQYPSVAEYVSTLFRRFDINRDGAVSYQELRDGLRSMKVALNDNETKALFHRLDADHDDQVSQNELFEAISSVNGRSISYETGSANINSIILRVAQGAEKARTLEDFVIAIFKKFDVNQDGAVSQQELHDGLFSMNVRLSDTEVRQLFHYLDADHDGTVTNYELYSAICLAIEAAPRSGQHKYTSTDTVMWMIKKAGEKYSTLREYVDFLMRKFDRDNDGLVKYEELGQGLKGIEVKTSDQELLSLMRSLDKDRDGGISKFELYNALDAEFAGTKPAQNVLPGQVVDSILLQIKKQIDPYKSKGEQVMGLMKVFDRDQDGLISYNELVDGLRLLGINARRADVLDLFNRIDIDKDGIVTQMELSQALGLYSNSGSQSPSRLSTLKTFK